MQSDIVPLFSNVYSLGATGLRWKEIFMGPGTLNVAGPLGSTAVAKLGSDDNSILYAELGFATPFLNIGPQQSTQLAPGSIGGWRVGPTGTLGSSGYDLTAQQILTGAGGVTGLEYSLIHPKLTDVYQLAYASFASTVNITGTANIATFTELTYNSTQVNYGNYGWATGSSYIEVPYTGIYEIIPSIIFTEGNAVHTVYWWFQESTNNGATWTTISDSGNSNTLAGNGEELVATVAFMQPFNANDRFRIVFASSAAFIAKASNASGIIPNVPSIITTVKFLGPS